MSERIELEQLRLIDANANRAREGIRTAEDFLRFNAGEGRWSSALKSIRSSITQQLGVHFGNEVLVGSRHVLQDPLRPQDDAGPGVVDSGESGRSVAQRGLKRAQEALRVMEEFLRARYAVISAEFSRHRYTLYEAEQWLLGAGDAAAVVNAAQVYVLLTAALCKLGLMATAEAALKGGAKLLQLREKEIRTDAAYLAQARDLRRLCNDYGAVLICNDRVDVSIAAEAAGVHVGQGDLSPADVRKISGERLLVGRSTHSVEQAQFAVDVEGADYIAIGSIYETSTKQGRILAGLALAEEVCALNFTLPVYAIGGITLKRVPELKAVGVRRIAVSTAVIADADPERATKELINGMAK